MQRCEWYLMCTCWLEECLVLGYRISLGTQLFQFTRHSVFIKYLIDYAFCNENSYFPIIVTGIEYIASVHVVTRQINAFSELANKRS